MEKESGFQSPSQSPALFLSSLAKQPSESRDSTGFGAKLRARRDPLPHEPRSWLCYLPPALCSCLLGTDRQARTASQPKPPDRQTPSKRHAQAGAVTQRHTRTCPQRAHRHR